MASGGAVDVAAEEVVDGDVPFTGKFEPVAGVPPKYTVRDVVIKESRQGLTNPRKNVCLQSR
jgi:hypothetical protein